MGLSFTLPWAKLGGGAGKAKGDQQPKGLSKETSADFFPW